MSVISKKRTTKKRINSFEFIDLSFNPTMPGKIRVFGYHLSDFNSGKKLNGIKRKVAIYAPGKNIPLKFCSDRGAKGGSELTYIVSETDIEELKNLEQENNSGNWKVRITNLDARKENFYLEVSYPA